MERIIKKDVNGNVEYIELVCTVAETLVIDKACYWLSRNDEVNAADRKLAKALWEEL